MIVPRAYSRATAMAPRSPAPIIALAAKAMRERWSAAVEMNVLLPSKSVPITTAVAVRPLITSSTPKNAMASWWW